MQWWRIWSWLVSTPVPKMPWRRLMNCTLSSKGFTRSGRLRLNHSIISHLFFPLMFYLCLCQCSEAWPLMVKLWFLSSTYHEIYEYFWCFELPFLLPFLHSECDDLRGPQRCLQLRHHQGLEGQPLEEWPHISLANRRWPRHYCPWEDTLCLRQVSEVLKKYFTITLLAVG